MRRTHERQPTGAVTENGRPGCKATLLTTLVLTSIMLQCWVRILLLTSSTTFSLHRCKVHAGLYCWKLLSSIVPCFFCWFLLDRGCSLTLCRCGKDQAPRPRDNQVLDPSEDVSEREQSSVTAEHRLLLESTANTAALLWVATPQRLRRMRQGRVYFVTTEADVFLPKGAKTSTYLL